MDIRTLRTHLGKSVSIEDRGVTLFGVLSEANEVTESVAATNGRGWWADTYFNIVLDGLDESLSTEARIITSK